MPTRALPKYLSLLRWFVPPSCVLSSAKNLFSMRESITYHLGFQCCYECWEQNKSSVSSRTLRKQQVYELSRTLVSRLEAPFFVSDSNTEGMVFPVPTCILDDGLLSLLYWLSFGVSQAYRVHCMFLYCKLFWPDGLCISLQYLQEMENVTLWTGIPLSKAVFVYGKRNRASHLG